ncbi:hypothetical protein [Corynebacterium bovis]|uniref:hypothetical protein n=1 Tax=Corynebacterium bovis TaxID=36808 RepID=UPI003138DA85
MNTVGLNRVESAGGSRGAGDVAGDQVAAVDAVVARRFNRLSGTRARRRSRWVVWPLLVAGVAVVTVPVVFTTLRLGATTSWSWPTAAAAVVLVGVIAVVEAADAGKTTGRRSGRWAGPLAVGVTVTVLLWAAVLAAWAVIGT